MPVPGSISDLSTTAASNSPSGSDPVFPDLDNFLRAYGSFIADLRNRVIDATTDANLKSVTYSGTLTGGTGVVNLGSGQFHKDASGNVCLGNTSTGGYRFVVTSPNATATDLTVTQSFVGTYSWQMPASVNALRLWNGSSASELFRFTHDGRIYGTALHNNAGSVTGSTNQYIASGTYTPTLTGVSNVSSASSNKARWTRVGNVVTVYGRADITPTATGGVSFGVSLPIASNLASSNEDLTGVFSTTNGAVAGTISADTTNDRAACATTASLSSGSSWGCHYSFSYEVL